MPIEQVRDAKVVAAAREFPSVSGGAVDRVGFVQQLEGAGDLVAVHGYQRKVAQGGCGAGYVVEFSAQGQAVQEVRLRLGEITGGSCDDAEAVQAGGLTCPIAAPSADGERFLEAGPGGTDVASSFKESPQMSEHGRPQHFVGVRCQGESVLQASYTLSQMTVPVPKPAERVC